jgi:hypothetical protein
MATGEAYCPVMLFSQYYMFLCKAYCKQIPGKGFFLPSISKVRGRYVPKPLVVASHQAMRTTQITVLSGLSLDWKAFGLHSGKIGGAMEAGKSGKHSKESRTLFGGWNKNSDMADHYDKAFETRALVAIATTLRLVFD